MQFRFCRFIWMWIVRFPDDHRDAAGLALCHPTFIVFVVPLGESGRLAQFTRLYCFHNDNSDTTNSPVGERLKADLTVRLQH